MSLVAKFFIQSEIVSPSGSRKFTLGAVCRGEENKHWAAATPSGQLECPSSPVLADLWARKINGELPGNPEVFVYVTPDPSGLWKLMRCEFSYGGVQVEFRLDAFAPDYQWGKYTMTVNNSGATKVLREMFAKALVGNEPPTFSLSFEEATPDAGLFPSQPADVPATVD